MVEVFREGQLEQLCLERIGPINESSFTFVSRMFSKLVGFVTNPPKQKYELADLNVESSEDPSFTFPIHPFTITSSDGIISCVLWEVTKVPAATDLCIVYVHTNTRSLADAKEVLPLAECIGANVVAFDLPGAGRSEGFLTASSYLLLGEVIAACEREAGCRRVILWGRGTGTFPLMQFLATSRSRPETLTTVKFVVLDTPFSSFKSVLDDLIERYEQTGNYFPHTLFTVTSKLIRVAAHHRIGIDLYDIKPIDLCHRISVPALVLAALSDDYIGTHHGHRIRSGWGGRCSIETIEGAQFSQRSARVLVSAAASLLRASLHSHL